MNHDSDFDAEAHTPEEAMLPPASDFPWPPVGDESPVNALARTWQESTFHPARFFAAMPEGIRMGPALVYYILVNIAVAGAGLFWSQILPQPEMDPALMTGPFAMLSSMSPLIEFLLTPIFAPLFLLVGAGLTHAMLLLLTTQRGPYARTACVFSFAVSPAIFGVVPYVGTLVGAIWMVVLAVIGLREAHRTTTGRAVAAILLPAVVLGVLLMVIVMVAVAGAVLITG